ncbi:MAG: hypothetical protein ONB05_06420 [candidate division KSB1 bacterium]|nr:hypothetical protein [candidate division KSB1 bacterium]
MNKKIINKNIELLNQFNRYLVENPNIAETIPPDAEVVILPIDDRNLLQANLKILEKLLLKRTAPTVLVKVLIGSPKTKPEAITQPLGSPKILSFAAI